MTADLKRVAEAAKAEHEKTIQARRIAEFEHATASVEAREADKRRRKAEETLEKARVTQRDAGALADEAFFNLAKQQVAESGSVRG